MTDSRAHDIWKQILAILDEKLQYAMLEQAKNVVDVRLEGSELTLVVSGEEARQFFSAEVNQQRLTIVSRPVISLSKVTVATSDSSPIN